MPRRSRSAQKVQHVAQRGCDQHYGRPGVAVVSKPIGKAAHHGREQVMPKAVIVCLRVERTRQEESNQAGEDNDGNPIVSGFHVADIPCLARRRPWHKIVRVALAGTVGLLLCACRPTEPTGQVIAVVDGVEITLAELNNEAKARNFAIRTDMAQRDAALAGLVERKLLVRAAHARGIDQTPDFVLNMRRMREILLAQQLVVRRVEERAPATERQLQQLIAGSLVLSGPNHPPPKEQRQLALAMLERQRVAEALAEILSNERNKVTVRYQRGFAPGQLVNTSRSNLAR